MCCRALAWDGLPSCLLGSTWDACLGSPERSHLTWVWVWPPCNQDMTAVSACRRFLIPCVAVVPPPVHPHVQPCIQRLLEVPVPHEQLPEMDLPQLYPPDTVASLCSLHSLCPLCRRALHRHCTGVGCAPSPARTSPSASCLLLFLLIIPPAAGFCRPGIQSGIGRLGGPPRRRPRASNSPSLSPTSVWTAIWTEGGVRHTTMCCHFCPHPPPVWTGVASNVL